MVLAGSPGIKRVIIKTMTITSNKVGITSNSRRSVYLIKIVSSPNLR